MKAMILAAGFGTRLKPYTNKIPKALIEINGVPLLELLIKKLKSSGISDIIINVHHFGEKIISFVAANDGFGINIQFSLEQQILGTGGGIKKAAQFFDDGKPFLVHNVDIITDLDLNDIYGYHLQNGYLATLAVKQRKTQRYFIVDQQNLICGHLNKKDKTKRIVRKPAGDTRLLAFSGIHIISPEIFPLITEEGEFSIVDAYLRLISAGYKIGVYQMDNYYWRDLGRIENIRAIEAEGYPGN